jgi:transposase
MSGGVELLEINCVGVATILTLISETGLEMSKFKTAKHFASWLGFAPNCKMSGGKVLSSHKRKKTNPLAKVIRDVVNAAGNSKVVWRLLQAFGIPKRQKGFNWCYFKKNSHHHLYNVNSRQSILL